MYICVPGQVHAFKGDKQFLGLLLGHVVASYESLYLVSSVEDF